jgi:hypothetical protein
MLQYEVIFRILKTFVTKYQACQNHANMDTNMHDCSMPLPQMHRRNCDGPIEEVLKQSPREVGGGGAGKGKSQADYRHDLGTNLITLSHRKEENTEGKLMSTGDAICVRQWLIE